MLEIDVWRGLGILLVVLAHAVQTTTASYDQLFVFRFIYAFHMPFFFFISGIVGARGLDRRIPQQLFARTKALVVPFVSWFVVIWLVGWLATGGESILDSFRELYFAVDLGLWFLWVLFLCTMYAAVLVRVPRLPRVLALALGCAALYAISANVLGLGLLRYYFAFFAAGIVTAPWVFSGGWLVLRRWWVAVGSAALYFLLVFGWRRAGLGLVPAAQWWEAIGMPAVVAMDLLYRYAAATMGILAVLSAATFLPLPSAGARFLSYFGSRTLEVYVSHALYLLPFSMRGLAWVPLATTFACSMSILTALALKQSKVLGFLFYGGRK